ncbi:MAG: hypothetical protein ACQR33_01315 [Candidatus Saccharibacteria bacterium]
MVDSKQILAQIDTILADVDRAKGASKYKDYSGGLADDELGVIATRLLAVLSRFALKDDAYYQQAQKAASGSNAHMVRDLGAILRALRADIDAGYVQTVGEIVRAEVFADFLEMADELQQKGYKDAAAVIAGSVLEGQLRKLAFKAGLVTTKGDGSPKKADTLNNDLATSGNIYNTLQQKSVLALLDLRNKAAHGQYSDYDHKQVAAMVRDVRDFLIRYPA